MEKHSTAESKPGMATDASGGPVVDPTANVIALNEAATRRQDDLRGANNRWIKSEIKHQKKLLKLQAKHAKELAAKESSRLDSIRQVDEVTKTAAQAQNSLAISTLAKQTTDIATTLSTQVQTTAQAAEARRQADMAEVTKRVSALELALSASVGKSTVTDPATAALAEEVRRLIAMQANEAGRAGVADPAIAELVKSVAALVAEKNTRTGFDAGKAAAIAAALATATAVGGGATALIIKAMGS